MASKTIIKLKLIFKTVNKSHEWLTYFRLNILKYVTVSNMVKPNVSPLTPVPGLIPFIYSGTTRPI